MIQNELKRCPFCGKRAKLADFTARPVASWVLMHKERGCLVRIVEDFATEKAAITAWNRRAPTPKETP